MATVYDINPSNIEFYRQGTTNSFWVKWSLTDSQKARKITRNVYYKKGKKGKKKKTTKNFSSCIASYSVQFEYKVSNDTDKWYPDKTIDGLKDPSIGTRADLWTPPEDAIAIRVRVISKSTKYQSGKKSKNDWFSANWSSYKEEADYDIYPSAPSISNFTINGLKVNAIATFNLSDFEPDEGCAIRYQILKDNKSFVMFGANNYETFKLDTVPSSGVHEFTTNLSELGSYQIRAAVANYVDPGNNESDYKWSEYSSWSSSVDTRPKAPELLSVKAIGADQVQLKWTDVPNITQYKIEYVNDNTRNFDSNMIQSTTVDNLTSYILSGLEPGHIIWFRVRSVNNSDESAPSNVMDVTLAVKPSAPTTWSSTTKAGITADVLTTEPVYLYWVHNSTDGSPQEYAKLRFKILDTTYYLTKQNTETDEYGETVDRISTLSLWDLTVYKDEANNTSAGTIYSIFKAAGAESIKWKVSTKGAHNSYSDWSIERTIEAYEKPNLELRVTDSEGNPLVGDILKSFPLHITGIVTPSSQTPISFHMSITAGGSYSTNDQYGNTMEIIEGTEIFSKHLDTDSLDYILTPADVDFVSNVSYILNVVVFVDSGLNAESSYEFSPEWDEISEIPDAIIDINDTYRYATITPYCNYFIGYDASSDATVPEDYVPECYFGTGISGSNDTPTVYSSSGVGTAVPGDMYLNSSTYEVYVCTLGGNASTATWLYRTKFNYPYAKTWYTGEVINGENEDDIYPTSGISSAVVNDYYLNTATGDIFKCTVAGDATIANWVYVWNCFWEVTPNVSLSVYRRESNGTYVTVMEGIDNTYQSSDDAITVRDPHPSFGECSYRIVATNIQNGAIGFADIAVELDETSVIIQWDEVWHDVEENPEGEIFEGSILELPANIKIADQNSNDVDLVSYIGRERPVSYYGTQRGEGLTINCDFDKEDTDTLSMVRRLMAYRGNVYVREPSGLGYWSNVTVSYNKDYSSLVIPVTLTIKPVEGGM